MEENIKKKEREQLIRKRNIKKKIEKRKKVKEHKRNQKTLRLMHTFLMQQKNNNR